MVRSDDDGFHIEVRCGDSFPSDEVSAGVPEGAPVGGDLGLWRFSGDANNHQVDGLFAVVGLHHRLQVEELTAVCDGNSHVRALRGEEGAKVRSTMEVAALEDPDDGFKWWLQFVSSGVSQILHLISPSVFFVVETFEALLADVAGGDARGVNGATTKKDVD